MIQNGTWVNLLQFIAADNSMKKIYKPDRQTDWSGLVWYGNKTQVPRDKPECGWNNELCEQNQEFNYISMVIPVVIVFVVSAIVTMLGIWKYQNNTKLKVLDLANILWSDVTILDSETNGYRANTRDEVVLVKEEHYRREMLENVQAEVIKRLIVKEILQMLEITHDNISKFVGICLEPGHVSIFMAWESRGSLWNIIEDEQIEFDLDFKSSILTDIACGMAYLHQSSVENHGWLTSQCCLIDCRWSCKISGYGLKSLRYKTGIGEVHIPPSDLVWTSPEMLGSGWSMQLTLITNKSDIYSYGIIVQEVILEERPFAFNNVTNPVDVIELVRKRNIPPFIPYLPEDVPEKWKDLMHSCWKVDANLRPTFGEILYSLRAIDKYIELTFVEKIINRMAKHTQKLETLVVRKKMEIQNEKCKMEYLLEELLPKCVIGQLRVGDRVEPEIFEDCTVFFSDIVGFTHISARSSPVEIVEMLNNMYTCFDNVASKYDVYKVATIGDAYMVASGIPIRNGDQHGAEICGMALGLLESIQMLTIDHLPGTSLQLRMGIHSGPCVGGVVGTKMPRYFIFGETVDSASRMESGGHPMKIHISESTKYLIEGIEIFRIELRGDIEIKGKGFMKTFWLLGRTCIMSNL